MSSEDEAQGFVMDRGLQQALLLKMRSAFPQLILGYPGERGVSQEVINSVLYLQANGLCEALVTIGMDGHTSWGGAKITARGLDFLEDDGGLTAILGVVTVKLHADTVRQLLESKIDRAEIPEEEKSALRKHLKSLSQTALQAAMSDLVRTGIDHLPNAIQWLRTLGSP